jgi:hypothetical protein
MSFVVATSALVSAPAGNADLVFLHGIGEGALRNDGSPNGLDAVRIRSPFLNPFACANFRLIAPQLANRKQRWRDRLDDLADLIKGLRETPEDRARPLFLCGFSIGGAGVVDAVNNFAAGNRIAVHAWCAVDAALPDGVDLPPITAAAAGIRHLLVRGPWGFKLLEEIVVPEVNPGKLSHHALVAKQVFEEGRTLVGERNLYEWFLA